jgi:hypothetical protein
VTPLPDFYIGAHAAVAGPRAADARRPPVSNLLPAARAHRAVTESVRARG